MTNAPLSFDEFVKAEPAVRGFQRFTSEQRSGLQASHRLGHQQRHSIGEDFWTHPRRDGVCFATRKQALQAGYAAYLIANEYQQAA